jgi:hypothetical protein
MAIRTPSGQEMDEFQKAASRDRGYSRITLKESLDTMRTGMTANGAKSASLPITRSLLPFVITSAVSQPALASIDRWKERSCASFPVEHAIEIKRRCVPRMRRHRDRGHYFNSATQSRCPNTTRLLQALPANCRDALPLPSERQRQACGVEVSDWNMLHSRLRRPSPPR